VGIELFCCCGGDYFTSISKDIKFSWDHVSTRDGGGSGVEIEMPIYDRKIVERGRRIVRWNGEKKGKGKVGQKKKEKEPKHQP
jgi:hypothetical protein